MNFDMLLTTYSIDRYQLIDLELFKIFLRVF